MKYRVSMFAAAVLIAVCVSEDRGPCAEKTVPVLLVSRGYHTGIIVPSGESAAYILPLAGESSGFAEFGWGESYYYQAPAVSLSDAPRALFFSKGSVVRLEFCGEDLRQKFASSGFVVRFDLTEKQFRELCRFIDESFLKKNGLVMRESVERDGAVGYYTSVHHYGILNTCNTWAARALEAAGTGVSGTGIVFAFQLRNRAAGKGTIVK